MTGAPCVTGCGVNGGGVVAVAALALDGKESWNALLLTLTGGLTLARYVWCSGTISPITPGCRSARTGFSADQLARATSGLVLAAVVISLWLQLGLPDELSRFTPFVWRCRLSRWPGTMVGKGRCCDVDERHRADRQSNLARSSVDLLLSLLVQSLTGLLLGAGSSGCVNLTSRCKRNWRAISIG